MTRLVWGVGIVTVVVFGFGWFGSTRHVDMRFSMDGVPCAHCDLRVFGPGNGEELLPIDEDGWVRVPGRFVGRLGVCAIKRGDETLKTFFEESFSRGITKVNFKSTGVVSEHHYRFLLYSETKFSETVNHAPSDEENGGP